MMKSSECTAAELQQRAELIEKVLKAVDEQCNVVESAEVHAQTIAIRFHLIKLHVAGLPGHERNVHITLKFGSLVARVVRIDDTVDFTFNGYDQYLIEKLNSIM